MKHKTCFYRFKTKQNVSIEEINEIKKIISYDDKPMPKNKDMLKWIEYLYKK